MNTIRNEKALRETQTLRAKNFRPAVQWLKWFCEAGGGGLT